MKGAIGNAFILNMVITFIIIFFTLLIGSMAYSKAYKVKNYLINEIDVFEKENIMPTKTSDKGKIKSWDDEVNIFLREIGYTLSVNPSNTCTAPSKGRTVIPNGTGRYDYCIYIVSEDPNNVIIQDRYHYTVEAYMKLDLPVIGKLLRLPVRGDTKTYTKLY